MKFSAASLIVIAIFGGLSECASIDKREPIDEPPVPTQEEAPPVTQQVARNNPCLEGREADFVCMNINHPYAPPKLNGESLLLVLHELKHVY
ncbi:hypothetical protein TWF694_004003 [Orbilia ellipsospora]|uniref:Uncharacterized protein n=1 Tax=Orbilia ellipsospora TaxID=2528407 RepID=A0AAV9WWQ6_9PEZI